MNEPLVSVIVPVYKVEDYLDKCVESIVKQTYKNLEIILVDDGSPDNCPSMCDSWAQKDSRIKVIHKENGGVSSARNSASFEAAERDFVYYREHTAVERVRHHKPAMLYKPRKLARIGCKPFFVFYLRFIKKLII